MPSCDENLLKVITLTADTVWTVGFAKLWLRRGEPVKVGVCHPEELGVCRSKHDCHEESQEKRILLKSDEKLIVGAIDIWLHDSHKPVSLVLCYRGDQPITKQTI